MSSLAPTRIETPRITMNVWTSGPHDGVPLLLVHGNLSSGGFWKYVAEELGDDVRVIAPDMRGFGDTDPAPIDATRGLGDMVDDVHALLDALGLAGQSKVNAAGWSMGGGVLQQLMLEYPDDLASVTLIAPLSPYGYGGTKGPDGERCTADAAACGAGGANQMFISRLVAKDASEDWPGLATGDKGILNTMSPKYYDSSAIADLERKPEIVWLRGTEDKVVSDASLFDLATLGQMGAIPGWPGDEVAPPQPMELQTRTVLDRYRENGGAATEAVLEGIDHGIPLAVPARVAEEITRILVR
ncbi:MAG TPA: alpha/beta hydrolase [Tessaracoccus flavescens]|uniref:Alpha/beta hydrolase n=1 Tax=Tessaracoccus flavescens TaxID=399497 RepID=A0A921JR02_9ACTN|nr:alpha/beta hydrolase [Tessaracoccus flavescens]